ncbi:MAG: sugar phosphate isomerase/epimerase family protein [Thermogutta sp.]
MTLSRRDVLRTAAAAGLCAACGKLPAWAAEKKIPIGVQLYSVREAAAKNLARVLAAIKEMGYEAVEFAGYYGHSAAELRKMLDDSGLKCCGTHTGWDTLQPNNLAATVEFNHTIGNKYLICPYLAESFFATKEKAAETAELFNALAEKVQDQGMLVGYHAHGGDFRKVNGETAWEAFFSATKPEVVMQMDIGNCLGGGGDPYAILEKFPGKSKTVHLKEHGGKQGAVIGEGEVDWERVFKICETTGGTEWYIVEQESYAGGPLDAIRGCIQNLRKMGK